MSALLPWSWQIRELPARALGVVLAVQALAVAVLVLAFGEGPATAVQWSFAIVAAGTVVLGYVAECRVGTAGTGRESTTSQNDGWALALAIVCPGWLGMLSIITGHALQILLYRIGLRPTGDRKRMAYKTLYNGSAWALGIGAGHLAWQAVGGSRSEVSVFAGAVLAGAVFVVVIQIAMIVVMSAATGRTLRDITGEQVRDFDPHMPSLAMGGLTAAAWLLSPLMILFVFPLMLALQQALLHKKLLLQSRTDAKTGLANAEFWRQTAEAHVSRSATGGPALSLMVVDLDFFKKVNDTYGHLAGDDVLREVAVRLKGTVRPGDLVGRFGGEEFTVLLPGADPAAAAAVAERVRAAIEASPMPTAGGNGPVIPVTCSVGVASVLQGDQTALADVMEAADKALYAAKDGGRNQVRVARAVEV